MFAWRPVNTGNLRMMTWSTTFNIFSIRSLCYFDLLPSGCTWTTSCYILSGCTWTPSCYIDTPNILPGKMWCQSTMLRDRYPYCCIIGNRWAVRKPSSNPSPTHAPWEINSTAAVFSYCITSHLDVHSPSTQTHTQLHELCAQVKSTGEVNHWAWVSHNDAARNISSW